MNLQTQAAATGWRSDYQIGLDNGRAEQATRITELQVQLADWKALYVAVTSGASYWPNNWSQDVAMVAYALHLMKAQLEIERMRVVGCGIAAMGNTEKNKAERITKDNPYWTASYGDVCRAVDAEIELRCQLEAAKQVANDCRLVADNAIAEAVAAKKDAERMDWLDGKRVWLHSGDGYYESSIRFKWGDSVRRRKLRQAIDAAIAEGKQA